MTKDDFLRIVREEMKKNGKSVVDLCKAIGYEHSSVYRILEGNRNLRFETAAEMAEFAGLELDVSKKDKWKDIKLYKPNNGDMCVVILKDDRIALRVYDEQLGSFHEYDCEFCTYCPVEVKKWIKVPRWN